MQDFLNEKLSNAQTSAVGSFFDSLPELLPTDADKRFFAERLRNVPSHALGALVAEPRDDIVVSADLKIAASEARKIAASLGDTLATAAFFSVAVTLANLTGTGEVAIGRVVSLRGQLAEGDSIPGPLLNTVASAVNLRSLMTSSLRDCIQSVGSSLRKELPHAAAALRDVARAVGRKDLFECLFDFQEQASTYSAAKKELRLREHAEDSSSAAIDLQVSKCFSSSFSLY